MMANIQFMVPEKREREQTVFSVFLLFRRNSWTMYDSFSSSYFKQVPFIGCHMQCHRFFHFSAWEAKRKGCIVFERYGFQMRHLNEFVIFFFTDLLKTIDYQRGALHARFPPLADFSLRKSGEKWARIAFLWLKRGAWIIRRFFFFFLQGRH